MKTEESFCGVNCMVCDQFTDGQCRGCLNEEKKNSACEVPKCVRDMGLDNCIACTRVTFCKKRKRAIDKCFVFRPGVEFRSGCAYLLKGSSEEAYHSLAKLAFSGRKGLLLLGEGSAVAGDHPALGEIILRRLTHKRKDVSDIDIRNPELIVREVGKFVKSNGGSAVLLDSVGGLVESLGLTAALRVIADINEDITSSPSSLLLREGELSPEEKKALRSQIANFSTDYIIKSVSNPKRKEILDYLRQTGKSNFSELYRGLRYTMPPKLSFHLKILKEAGIIEQDSGGIYYVSGLGREIDELIKKMQTRVIKGEMVTRANPEIPEFDRYAWYKEIMRKTGAQLTLSILKDVESSTELIFGTVKSGEVLRTVLAEFIEGEKEMDKDDLRRMISEIAFVFLVDVMPLVDAIDWADELLVKHQLK
jgi:DNA-binding transcriptional ArsR family regulator